MSTHLTIGLVGLGAQGLVHAETLTELGHALMGADVRSEARQEFEQRFDAVAYEDISDLYAADVDAIVVTTPNKFHERSIVPALQHGYDVFCEKPLAHTEASAERIAHTAAEEDGFCMVGFHFRFVESVSILKEYIDEGYFGDIYHVEARQIRRRGIPGRGTWYTSNELAGGGALVDIGVHSIDLCLYLLDFPTFEDVMGITRTNFGDREDYAYRVMHGEEGKPHRFNVDDSATVLMQATTGQTATIEVAWAANTDACHHYYIHGTDAGAFLDVTSATMTSGTPKNRDGDDLIVSETRHQGNTHFFDGSVSTDSENAYRKQFEQFTTAVGTNQPPQPDTEQALEVQRIVDSIYESNT